MTAALPWTSAGVDTSYRGNPRVSTARATTHGASTANATVVATARAAVLSVARNPWYQHGNARKSAAIARQFPRTSNGHPRPLPRPSSDTRQLPRKSAAIAAAISADVKPQQFPRPSAVILRYKANAAEIHGNCHSILHGIPRPSMSIELAR